MLKVRYTDVTKEHDNEIIHMGAVGYTHWVFKSDKLIPVYFNFMANKGIYRFVLIPKKHLYFFKN